MKRRKRKNKFLVISFILVILGALSYYGYKLVIEDKIFAHEIEKGINQNNDDDSEPEKIIPKLKIIDTDSDSRPFAVMIDNNAAVLQHMGLQDAHIMYEIIVEGGITRFLAVFKDQETAIIGPVRSARHYYLDYALENDAVFVHFGHSPQTLIDIKTLKVNNINGIYDSNTFWRDKTLKAPHNVLTSMEKIKETVAKKKYRDVTERESLLSYSIEEINYNEEENATVANAIKIQFSSTYYVNYQYDEENKVYKRFIKGKTHTDKTTNKQYTFKNILVYSIKNEPLINGGAGRQEIKNIGSGSGHYISNGYAMPITWEKTSRSTPTIYKDADGNILKVNDGNTFIHLQPLNKTLTIEE